MAGYPIVIGSRDAGRASDAANGLLEIKGGLPITGAANEDAAAKADWTLLSVPYEGLEATTKALAPQLTGKIVTSVVAPLTFEGGVAKAVQVPQGSAAELVAGLLPDSRISSAFHNLSARDLLKPDRALEGDVIVCGNDEDARKQTVQLAESIKSLRGVDVGDLSNSRYIEDLTALLLNVNKRYKAHSTIKLVGL
jgi:NADPH-dependent F420 reductase